MGDGCGRQQRVLAVAGSSDDRAEDLIAGGESVDSFAHGFDDSCHLETERDRLTERVRFSAKSARRFQSAGLTSALRTATSS